MGVCSVVGCESRSLQSSGEGKHFFRFPKENLKNNKIRENWILFTKNPNFIPKDSSAICENHFTPDSFVIKKKGRLYLVKDSVPTIYLKQHKNKVEKIEINYDHEAQEYTDYENIIINQDSTEREKKLIKDRDKMVLEAKNLCRFCLESDNGFKCVSIDKLENFLKDSTECLKLLEVEAQYGELLSNIVCEKCFQVLVDFDAYRKRCRKAQSEFVQEILEIDQEIQEIGMTQKEQRIWYKEEVIEVSMDEAIEVAEQNFDLIEEHLEDDIYDESAYEEAYVGFTVESTKQENEMIEEDMIEAHDFIVDKSEDVKYENEKISESQDDYDINDKDNIVRSPETQAYRTYECFFCRLKFFGQKAYKNHDCQVKEIKCEFDGCEKRFTKQSGYNQHIVKVHKQTKMSKQFCALCKEVINSTDEQFKKHQKKCSKDLNNKDKVIECEICKKHCKNLKSYTVHKMFHDSRNLVKFIDESGSPKKINSPGKGPVICELCGNKFTNSQGLRTHKKNVHLIGSSGEVYQCDICSINRPTKRSLFNHMRNVHKIQKTPCAVCGKVFRTKALLQKHAMYHDESKRIHFCSMCPEKPGYFTAVALKRHQKSHHIGMKQHQCDFCDSSYTSSHMLKQHHRQQHNIEY